MNGRREGCRLRTLEGLETPPVSVEPRLSVPSCVLGVQEGGSLSPGRGQGAVAGVGQRQGRGEVCSGAWSGGGGGLITAGGRFLWPNKERGKEVFGVPDADGVRSWQRWPGWLEQRLEEIQAEPVGARRCSELASMSGARGGRRGGQGTGEAAAIGDISTLILSDWEPLKGWVPE